MKLIPKARPVRIRIMSGGMEHSNLKSLSENFSAKDVMESISNGCMVRWLQQCGETEIAESIESASGMITSAFANSSRLICPIVVALSAAMVANCVR